MSITEVGTATRSTSANVGITPSGVAAGDVMVAVLAGYNNSTNPTPPAGWTLIQSIAHPSGGDDNIFQVTFYYVCGSSTPATHTWIDPGGGQATIIMTAWRGVDNSTPVDAKSPADGFTANPTGASVTTAAGNMLLWLWMGDFAAMTVPPSGWAVDVDGTTATSLSPLGGGGGRYGAYHLVASGGSTGSIPSTLTGADDWTVTVIALLAAGGSPAGPTSSSFQVDPNVRMADAVRVCA